MMRTYSLGFLALLLVSTSSCGGSESPTETTDPPTPVATTLSLLPASVALSSLGEMQQLTATVLDQDGAAMAAATVVWSTSSEGIVTVSSDGLLTAAANGEAAITATSGSATGTVLATVAQVASSVILSAAELTLSGAGATRTLTVTAEDAGGSALAAPTATWSSNDEEVVTVVGGVVTAVAIGSATVTAQVGALSATAIVTVIQPEVLVACAFSGSGGDFTTRGFYLDDFPGDALVLIEMQFAQVGQAERTLTLIARSATFDGPVLGESAPVTFTPPELGTGVGVGLFRFTSSPVMPGTLVTFELVLEPGVDNSVYYDVGGYTNPPSDCPVVQTDGTGAPLDSYRRAGLGIKIYR